MFFIPAAKAFAFVSGGDLSTHDFEAADFTKDDVWRELDLSSIVGVGKRLVLLFIDIRAAEQGKMVNLRTKGHVNIINIVSQNTQVVDYPIQGDYWIETDESGKIEYYFSYATWGLIFVDIRGWIIL